ncbi:hypothetical protein PCNPT3_05845 [Psychromonas sp. CNPT3]|uniref:DUF342 domain-containing protein n=1 Tax=Psychromonas sp. CNPT3 TaxID=314282 RepID=UPI00006E80DA|nr:FapA family protein [Psychromonas sp. CNPT3]AGH81111.1 hypothetical protein PCNPT3_05845 [Psychromonas sp. CNPT3]
MDSKNPLHIELLHFSTEKKSLFIKVQTLPEDISAAMIHTLFLTSQFSHLKVDADGIKKAAKAFNQRKQDISTNNANQRIIIAEQLDAKLILSIDPLKMFVEAQITSAFGGKAATLEQLQECITKADISYGLQPLALEQIITLSASRKPGHCTKRIVAKGKPPIQGTNTHFKALVETPKERLFKPKKLENGNVDMRDLGQLLTVIPGDTLMQKIPHQEGEDGCNVNGSNIAHVAGKELNFEIGKNTALSDSDENLLVATLAGIPKSLNNGMEVDDVLIIKRVDVNYGHVKYKGNVIIEGDICEGMQVTSTGDITVAGFVDSATIKCGGDLTVANGIVGRQINSDSHEFSCSVQCDGTLTATFSQYSKIVTGQDLNIKKQLLHCHVLCGAHIKVHNESATKGRIIGGYLAAQKSLCTTELGALAGSKTVIDLTGPYPQLIDLQHKIKETQQQLQTKLQDIRLLQTKVKSAAPSDKQKTMLKRIALTMLELNNELHELQQKGLKTVEDVTLYFAQTHVVITKKMFDDVIICIGDKKFRSIRNYGPTKVGVENKMITAEPYLKP